MTHRRLAALPAALAVLCLCALFAPASAKPALTKPVFAPGAAWDWQLSRPVDFSLRVPVLDTDPDLIDRRAIARLRRRGVYLICYVSVGTLEKGRADEGRFPRAVIGRTYAEWPDERFLDIRRLDVLLPLMRARFARCKRLGFDAIEPDNMDGHGNDTGFPLTRADTLRYVRALARMAHEMGLAIGQKNAPELSAALAGTLDFAITESCFQDRWCEKMAPWRRAGKPVLDAEYLDRPLNRKAACRAARRLGLSMIFKDRDLTKRRLSCR